MTTQDENKLAALSVVSPEEIRTLFQALPQDTLYPEARCNVWTTCQREAYKQMRLEDGCDE